MGIVVSIKLHEGAMPKYYDPKGLELNLGDLCVVEYEKREEIGVVASVETHCDDILAKGGLPQVLRRAQPKEIRRWERRKKREIEAMQLCKEKAEQHGLNIKVSDVYIDDRNRKVIFHFTADKRVDFRALVKDLAASLKARIELWQIGVRAEAQSLDGYGICGRRLCCAGFLARFTSISLKMAKEQDLILSPSKLSGVCGRLMCCLAFEQDLYKELSAGAPPIGAFVKAKKVEGEVIDRNLLTQTFVVKDRDGNASSVKRPEITEVLIPEDIEAKQKELKEIELDEGEPAQLPPDDTEIDISEPPPDKE